MHRSSFLFTILFFYSLFQNGLQKISYQVTKAYLNGSKLNQIKIVKDTQSSYLINLLNIYVCTTLVIIGTLGNLLSFIVFLRAGKKNPRIITKNLLILLTLSNSLYLQLFWYMMVFPKIINHFKLDPLTNRNLNFTKTFNLTLEDNRTIILAPKTTIGRLFIEKFYQINSNIFVCKIMSYLISVSILLNSSLTTTFSVERALAINFPLKMRNIRDKHRFLFKIIIMFIIFYCFVIPIYHLYLSDMIKHGNNQFQKKCDIPLNYESLYFKFTMMFVIQTLTFPFILITISNVSIAIAIERNRRSLLQKRFTENISDNENITEKIPRNLKLVNGEFSFERCSLTNNKNVEDSLKIKRFIFRSRKNLKYSSSVNSSCKIGGREKNMHITKMLLLISASFVLLNFPYFIAWCRYALFRVYNSKPFNEEQVREIMYRYSLVKLAEILNLLNYAVTGLLYFATGKVYRQNLYAFFRCGSVKKKADSMLYS